MRNRFLALLSVAALLSLPVPGAETVDEIIAKNIAARGGMDKLKAVQAIRATGRITFGQGLEAPFTLELKRTNKIRLEFTVQGLTGVQAYDGKMGWQIMPFTGKKDPEPTAGEDLKAAEEQADIDGPLVDYKAKGHQVELIGKEKVEGTDTYKLKITLKNGNVRYDYLDTDTHLQIKGESKRMVRGNEVELEESIGDYKPVGGVMFPHAFESGPKGSQQRQKIIVEKVELNPAIDDARFVIPAAKPADTKQPAPKPPLSPAR